MPFMFNPIKTIRRRLQRSIQTKLAIVLLLVGFISLSCLGLLSVWLGKTEVQNEVGKRNREVAVLVSGQVSSYLQSILSDLNFAARSFMAVNPGVDNEPLIVFRLLKKASDQTYQSLAWIDRNGVRRSFYKGPLANMENQDSNSGSSLLDQRPLDMSNDPAFLTTKTGKPYYSPVTFTPDGLDPVIFLAVPILDNNNTFMGSLIVEANLKKVLEIVNSVKSDRTTVTILVDENSTVIASSTPEGIGNKLPDDQLKRSINGQVGSTEFTNRTGDLYLAGFAPVTEIAGWNVIVAQAASEALSGITRMALIALAVVIVAIILISFIAILLSKTITRPVRELAIAANRITTTGSLDEQIPITSQDEVGELSAAFNGMILALRKTRQALEHWNRELGHKVEVRTVELTRTNEKLELINDQLERANLHKSQFLANMSHELRTPLNAIIGFSEVLQDQVFGDLNEKQLRYITNILTSGRHLLNLVNDVLDLSKVEAGKMELHWEEFSARQSIGEVITQLGTLAYKKELKINFEVSPDLDQIMADKGRFRQILYNLVSNAIKFTPQGGMVKIAAKIQPENEAGASCALFQVEDSGIGISAEHLETIFESFRQVDNSYSRQYQGTGLGLALTRKLVEMHGGKIWVNSTPGVGSTFSFTIPAVTPNLPTFAKKPEELPIKSL
ncbi:MAG TPA: ATP-binding protein [Chloroflexia bacterium]|nr:ATP-binding protein [Chloroflexia bacterium]